MQGLVIGFDFRIAQGTVGNSDQSDFAFEVVCPADGITDVQRRVGVIFGNTAGFVDPHCFAVAVHYEFFRSSGNCVVVIFIDFKRHVNSAAGIFTGIVYQIAVKIFFAEELGITETPTHKHRVPAVGAFGHAINFECKTLFAPVRNIFDLQTAFGRQHPGVVRNGGFFRTGKSQLFAGCRSRTRSRYDFAAILIKNQTFVFTQRFIGLQ